MMKDVEGLTTLFFAKLRSVQLYLGTVKVIQLEGSCDWAAVEYHKLSRYSCRPGHQEEGFPV